MPTIKDVAREAGVSIATVSYVINNKDSSISEDTRRQVLQAVKKVGYTPNVTARNLKSSQTKLIGYAWHRVPPDQVNSVLDHFTYYLAQAAEALGYHILTFTHTDDDWRAVYDDLIRTRRVDAFVLASTKANDPRIRFLMDHQFPFVSFGRSNPDWDFPWVDTDGHAGMRDAVRYLVSLGHRRVAMVAWPEDSISGSYRVSGYLDGLESTGIPFRPDYLWRGEHREQTGRDAVAYWSRLPLDQQPTAVVAISDLTAIGVMNEAQYQGHIVGETLAVIGFDDVPLGQYLRPALSSLRQPILEISQTIIDMLQGIIQEQILIPTGILLPPQLIVRESCGGKLHLSDG